MRRQLGAGAIVSAFVVACASLTGADDLYVGRGNGGATSSGDPVGEEDGGSVQRESGTDVDADVDPPLPQCTGGVCVPTSDGWAPAANPSGAGCPAGWPSRTAYKAAQPFSCNCTCTPNGGSCEGPLTATNEGFNCGGAAKPLPDLPGDGGCVATKLTAFTITSPTKLTSSPTNPPTACTAAPSPIGGGTSDVAVCTGAESIANAQCKATESCLEPPEPGSQLCIVHEGSVPCPSGFGRRTEISTGTVTDNRSCSSCACGIDCNGGKLEAFFGTNCTTPYGTANLGSCQPTPFANGSSFRYTAGNGCGVSQPSQVEGTVDLPAPMTLCCLRRSGG